MHDALEDTLITEEVIEDNFSEDIVEIVLANTKRLSLPKSKIKEDLIERCVLCWENALIVKVADIYDNYLFYKNENIPKEIERCKILAELIGKHKPDDWNDKIFELLDKIN